MRLGRKEAQCRRPAVGYIVYGDNICFIRRVILFVANKRRASSCFVMTMNKTNFDCCCCRVDCDYGDFDVSTLERE